MGYDMIVSSRVETEDGNIRPCRKDFAGRDRDRDEATKMPFTYGRGVSPRPRRLTHV